MASAFFFADLLIDRMGGAGDETADATSSSTLVVPLVLGATLDGIPESVVIGLGLRDTHVKITGPSVMSASRFSSPPRSSRR